MEVDAENNAKDANHKSLETTTEQESIGEQIRGFVQITGAILLLILQIFYYQIEALYRYFVPLPLKPVKGEIVLVGKKVNTGHFKTGFGAGILIMENKEILTPNRRIMISFLTCPVTGAGHGIGKQLALNYASEGATVVTWDINKENNKSTVREISQLGYPKAYAYTCDVSNRNNVLEVARKVQQEVGDVTILINNAGIMPTHKLDEHTPEEIERIFGINVFAHFWTLEAFLEPMKRNNHGHIVALSSSAGLVGIVNLVPYCASKFAVYGLVESLHEELRMDPKCRVKCTVICPYMVDTGLCKRPKIRFEKAMPLLNPQHVAKEIMTAQRSDVPVKTIPGYILKLNYYTRLLPAKAQMLVKDFIDAGVENDL